MKKTGKMFTALFLAAAMAASLLTGCGGFSDSSGNVPSGNTEAKQDTSSDAADTTVSVALWGNQLLENYAPWLQSKFPDIDFDFIVVNNSAGYYKFRAEHDTLPDILTVRRFALRDVESLKGLLLDLSDTELTDSFYQTYLRSYTYADGTVNWLPACAEIDDIIANKTLFEENDIPLPTDYESFVSACAAFEKRGITGYVTDFSADYSCMETLQGFSAALLTSDSGREWRELYESGETDELSEEVWLPAFEKMERLIGDIGIDQEMLDQENDIDIKDGFENGTVAMYRGTGEDLTKWGGDFERLMLPYPGDTEEDGWYLTYPAFQVAASARAGESEERKERILSVMTAMLGEEGIQHIATGKNMVAYTKDADIEILPTFDNIRPYMENNQLYIRLASSDMFSVSKDVVQRMISGDLADARSAFDEFNRQLRENRTEAPEAAVHIGAGYRRAFEPGVGSEAASAVYNTLREETGADCVIGHSDIAAGDILEGDYTEAETSYMINWDAGNLLRMELTGDRLADLVEVMLTAKGSRDSVANDSTLPVVSGVEMEIARTEDGYRLERLTKDGNEIDPEKTFSVVYRIGYTADKSYLEEAGFTDHEILDEKVKALLLRRLTEENGQLSAPTAYITLN